MRLWPSRTDIVRFHCRKPVRAEGRGRNCCSSDGNISCFEVNHFVYRLTIESIALISPPSRGYGAFCEVLARPLNEFPSPAHPLMCRLLGRGIGSRGNIPAPCQMMKVKESELFHNGTLTRDGVRVVTARRTHAGVSPLFPGPHHRPGRAGWGNESGGLACRERVGDHT
jgi:hypothetical protein